MASTSFLWLEITGRCQLECVHCYAESGSSGSHGVMTRVDWLRVLDEAAELGMGMVQFIGGEPTLHPDLAELVEHAVERGLAVEVFSNLVHVSTRLWEVFGLPGVRLACSYYSDDPEQHTAITGRASRARTRANIVEALRRSIPLRVGVVDLGDEQRTRQAADELTALGVADVGYDRLRQVGRGMRGERGEHGATLRQLRFGGVGHCVVGRGVAVRVLPLAAGGQCAHRPVGRDCRERPSRGRPRRADRAFRPGGNAVRAEHV